MKRSLRDLQRAADLRHATREKNLDYLERAVTTAVRDYKATPSPARHRLIAEAVKALVRTEAS